MREGSQQPLLHLGFGLAVERCGQHWQAVAVVAPVGQGGRCLSPNAGVWIAEHQRANGLAVLGNGQWLLGQGLEGQLSFLGGRGVERG
jgi:hypothetical protein